MTTIIIGAGASGLAAATSLKQQLPCEKVIILERLSSPASTTPSDLITDQIVPNKHLRSKLIPLKLPE